jgi:hypothetical protein
MHRAPYDLISLAPSSLGPPRKKFDFVSRIDQLAPPPAADALRYAVGIMKRASIYGRLGADPVRRATRTGGAMATASVAVNVARGGDAEWVSVLAFGATAEVLSRHRKGDVAAVMGRLCRSCFTGRGYSHRRFRAHAGGDGVVWLVRQRGGVLLRTRVELPKLLDTEAESEALRWFAAWPDISPEERADLVKAAGRGQRKTRP